METYETLNEKTVAELRGIIKQRGIIGYSRKTKDLTIHAILDSMANDAPAPAATPVKELNDMNGLSFQVTTIVTKPNAGSGNRNTTTIQVSSGANKMAFPVIGFKVGQVQEQLKEALNIDLDASGMVNGSPVDSSYVLCAGDVLEYIKPAGRKG